MKSKIKMKRENKIKSTVNNLDKKPIELAQRYIEYENSI